MNKQFRKIILVGLFLSVVALGAFFYDRYFLWSNQINPAAALEVDFLDVGQGDSEYIRLPDGRDILIDGGPDNQVLNQLGRVMPFFDTEIDFLILTHPHADHVVGLNAILKKYHVKEVYLTGVLYSSPDYLAWLKEVKRQNLKIIIVKQPFDLLLAPDLTLKFLFPDVDYEHKSAVELNDTSIVNQLVYKNEKILFTGDAGFTVENELLQNKVDLRSNVLKVGHHGSAYASAEEFLNAVEPEFAVISVGAGNSFGHPSLAVVRRLERLPVMVFRTDQDGLITLVTDGEKIVWKK
jgi:competence protein ComEC